jgi:drug/metabolite transporter (DMT)-like permease
MTRSLGYYVPLILTACGLVASQILLKYGVASAGSVSITNPADLVGLIRRVLTSPVLLLGYGLSAFTALAWLVMLTRYDLSYASPMLSAVSSVLLLLVSAIVLREAVTPWRWAGALLVITGGLLLAKVG